MPVFVTPGNGGGGGSVNSVNPGVGVTISGPATDPIVNNNWRSLYVPAASFIGSTYTPTGIYALGVKTPMQDFNVWLFDGGTLLKLATGYTFAAGAVTIIGGAADILIQINN